jgi:hypothetical protein
LLESIPRANFNLSEPWTFYFLIGVLLLYIGNRAYHDRLYEKVLADFIFSKDTIIEEEQGFSLYTVILNIGFAINLSFILYQADTAFAWNLFEINGFPNFLIYTFLIGIVYLAKWLTHALNGLVFGITSITQLYLYHTFLGLRSLGLLLLPFSFFISYSKLETAKILLIIILSISALVWITRLVRVIIKGLQFKISLLYIILYLCALEASPVLFAIGYFDKN